MTGDARARRNSRAGASTGRLRHRPKRTSRIRRRSVHRRPSPSTRDAVDGALAQRGAIRPRPGSGAPPRCDRSDRAARAEVRRRLDEDEGAGRAGAAGRGLDEDPRRGLAEPRVHEPQAARAERARPQPRQQLVEPGGVVHDRDPTIGPSPARRPRPATRRASVSPRGGRAPARGRARRSRPGGHGTADSSPPGRSRPSRAAPRRRLRRMSASTIAIRAAKLLRCERARRQAPPGAAAARRPRPWPPDRARPARTPARRCRSPMSTKRPNGGRRNADKQQRIDAGPEPARRLQQRHPPAQERVDRDRLDRRSFPVSGHPTHGVWRAARVSPPDRRGADRWRPGAAPRCSRRGCGRWCWRCHPA